MAMDYGSMKPHQLAAFIARREQVRASRTVHVVALCRQLLVSLVGDDWAAELLQEARNSKATDTGADAKAVAP